MAHYRTVAAETGLPIFVYNIPGRTASRIEPETLARLAAVPGILGLKEAGGDLVKAAHTIALADDDFVVLSGDDALTLPLLAIGGRGVITTTGNVAPREVAGITQAAQSGDCDRARSLHYALLPLREALVLESNPIPVKAALASLGRIPEPTLRLPLTEISKPNRDRLEAALAGLERA